MARKTDHRIDFSKGVRGEDRKAHFASGGTLASWRGVKTVTNDKRKSTSKKGCRGRVRQREGE